VFADQLSWMPEPALAATRPAGIAGGSASGERWPLATADCADSPP